MNKFACILYPFMNNMKFSNSVIRPIFLSLVLMFALLANVSIAQTPGMPKRNVDDLTDDEIALFLERAQVMDQLHQLKPIMILH